ncbi:hypothetical protein QWZ08_17610 [Ferruginibacter paludis]|uniref:hypothetical protein n=1 Tax=Ferruginibacter paludis TaxID=1310417 RepID=UPI0025B58D9F|nr:hypothetical protein [Ferruginibacter paludis]MDN3657474.1 hypothetical protein [Ferruginibacter paludis]
MKIEFLDDISNGGQFPHADPDQLVRLYDFDNLQAQELRHMIQNIIIERKKDLDLTTLEFIQPINCNLTLQISDADKGIATSDNKKFVCNLTIEKYKEMVFLMEPFCDKETNGYQWLYDLDTPIEFLFSPGGSW